MTVSRRTFLAAPIVAGAVAATNTGLAVESALSDSAATAQPDFRFCLNTSTIRGQKLGIVEVIELVAKAGYDGIEPWIRELDAFVKDGGNLKELGKRIADHGLRVESAIGFANWIIDDDAQRAKGLETARRDMDMLKTIGGTHIAAPPVGAHRNAPSLDLFKVAERYRALLDVGDQIGVIPQAEVWGFSDNLSRLGETMFAVIESGHPKACILPDVYHIYKGGSDFAGMGAIAGSAIHCFHMNDYPSDPPQDTISDKDRVYPGDGVAPLGQILQAVAANGFSGVLSLELFNPDYWKQDPAQVITTGLAKMKASVAAAFA